MNTDETSIESTDDNDTTTEENKRKRVNRGGPRAENFDPRPPSEGGEVRNIGVDTDDGPEHKLYSITNRNRHADPVLVASIYKEGVNNPVTVTRNGPYYDLVVGHRRLMALREANKMRVADGLKPWPLPAFKFQGSEAEMIALIIRENAQRVEETPMEMARLALKLIKLGESEQDVATTCGYSSVNALKQLLDLNDLAPEVQKMVDDGPKNGGLSRSAALALNNLEHTEQVKQAKELLKNYAETGEKPTARTARGKADPNATVRPTKKEANRLITFLKKEAKLPKKDRYFDIGGPEGMDPAEFAHRIAGVLVGEYKQNRIKGLTAVLKGEKTHDKKEDEEE